MKLLLLLVAVVCQAVSAASGQQPMDASLEGTVQRVFETGRLWGYDTKSLARGGDGGAVVLTRLFADRNLTDNDIAKSLGILESSFSNLAWVEKPADREPRTALLLLRYLEFQAHSPDVRELIAKARRVILDRSSAYKKGTAPPVAP